MGKVTLQAKIEAIKSTDYNDGDLNRLAKDMVELAELVVQRSDRVTLTAAVLTGIFASLSRAPSNNETKENIAKIAVDTADIALAKLGHP